MWFANVLLRILAPMFISDIGLEISFFVVSLSAFGSRMMFHKKSLGVLPLLEIFGKVSEG